MHQYLVVANHTLGGPQLIDVIRDRMARGPADGRSRCSDHHRLASLGCRAEVRLTSRYEPRPAHEASPSGAVRIADIHGPFIIR